MINWLRSVGLNNITTNVLNWIKRDANEKFDCKSIMKGSCELNVYIDETLTLCCERDTLWFCVLF